MFRAYTLLTSLLLALAVSANPIAIRDSPVKLPLARHLNSTGLLNLVENDLARIKALRTRAQAKASPFQEDATPTSAINEPVSNQIVSYIATIGVGNPATNCNSNTWVGAGTAYKVTSTSKQTSDTVSVDYGSGYFTGTEYIDQVTIASGLVITGQSIGVASSVGTLYPDYTNTIPTVTDNAYSQGLIPVDQIGISFAPTNSTAATNGEISWGGPDSTKYTGSITYASLTTTYPSSLYWGIDQSITYGSSKKSILTSTAGVVDTGTTLIYIASDAYNRYVSATGATLDGTTGLLTITSAKYSSLQSLYFNINGASFELTASAQLWPRSLNTAIGGSASSLYLVIVNNGVNTGSGMDFINGYTFLERFYTVFDTANSRVGFATTSHTEDTTTN
ncbi:hypothetical protein H0H92_002269 [Tricholoma furcatifolium]|nr:hypothetical protein H0H92_002269 [Tricholoma furcatifolium]